MPGGICVKNSSDLLIPQPTLSEQRALIASLAKQRLRRFREVTDGDRDAISLYLLDSEIASHLHAGVRFVEVGLREKMHRSLSEVYGERWFDDSAGILDEGTLRSISQATAQVGPHASAGKVVAQLMLGTWVDLLGRGEVKADGSKARYVRDVWEPAFKHSFSIPRSELRALAMRINWARNRISHCEPVVFGLPMPGLGEPGHRVRRSPERLFADIQMLVAVTEPGLAPWIAGWGQTKALFRHELAVRALSHVADDSSVRLQL